jgi:hypothetical protein
LNDLGDAAVLAGSSGESENCPQQAIVMLETRHLSGSVGQRLLVQDVSVQVSADEILVVVPAEPGSPRSSGCSTG